MQNVTLRVQALAPWGRGKINYFAPGLETEDERDPHNEGVKLSFYPDTRTGTARNPWHN